LIVFISGGRLAGAPYIHGRTRPPVSRPAADERPIVDGSLRDVPLAVPLSDVTAFFDAVYDPAWAESWDAVGLVCGDPGRPVERVMFAVDPVAAVVAEAVEWGADLLITHHPLLLRPVSSVAATTPKGRLVHRLITAGVALYTAHTNADVADPGVSDALARAVGLTGPLRPLAPAEDPHDGGSGRGLGRVGAVAEPMPLADFAAQVAAGLPATAGGVRVAGDPDRTIRTVAVSGGAGDSLLGAARAAGVDVYLTADLRHHPASEFAEHDEGPALLDAAHWATEWPWLADAERLLTGAFDLQTRVSALVTDAWTISKGSEGAK
jgi:dinuclear metal center YbgI/SA1388 family protein